MVKKRVVKKAVKKPARAKKSTRSVKSRAKTISLKLKSSSNVFSPKKFGMAVGKLSALCVFVVSAFAMFGYLAGPASLLDASIGFLGYWPGTLWMGVVWGTVIGFVKGYVAGYLVAIFYNRARLCC